MGTNLTQFKYDLSQNEWLVFVVVLIYDFDLSFATPYYFVTWRAEKRLLTCAFRFYIPTFPQMLILIGKWKFCFIRFRLVSEVSN